MHNNFEVAVWLFFWCLFVAVAFWELIEQMTCVTNEMRRTFLWWMNRLYSRFRVTSTAEKNCLRDELWITKSILHGANGYVDAVSVMIFHFFLPLSISTWSLVTQSWPSFFPRRQQHQQHSASLIEFIWNHCHHKQIDKMPLQIPIVCFNRLR